MDAKTVVLLVSLGAVIAVGGRTIVTKTGQGIATVAHVVRHPKKPIKKVAHPFVWAAKRVAK